MSWVCKSANPISFTCTNIHALQAISHYSLLICQPVKLSKHHSWKNWGRNTRDVRLQYLCLIGKLPMRFQKICDLKGLVLQQPCNLSASVWMSQALAHVKSNM